MAGVGAVVGLRGQQEATRHALLAQAAEKEALVARDEALRSQSLSLSLLSQETAASGNHEAAILLALEALPTDSSVPGRPYVFEAEAALYNALLANREKRTFDHGARLVQAAFDRTGDRIVTSSFDRTARIWDVANGAQIAILRGHEGIVEKAEFSPDGSRVITAARDGTARVWDAASGHQALVLKPLDQFPTATFSPNGDRVLTAARRSDPTLWDPHTGAKILSARTGYSTTPGPYFTGNSLSGFSLDGSSFAMAHGSEAGFSQNIILIWSSENGALKQQLPVRMSPYSVAFSPDGNRLLINGWESKTRDNPSRLWDLSKGAEIATLAGHKSDTQLQGVMFSHDGRLIATASLDGTARLWDGISGSLLNMLGQESTGLKGEDIATDPRDRVMSSAFSKDDRYFATTSLDNNVRVWDVAHGSLFAAIKGHADLVKHVEFSPIDNNLVLTASSDGTARLWDIDGVLTTALRNESRPTFAIFSPDNLHLLTGGGDSAVQLWDVKSERKIGTFDTPDAVHAATFSPDGSRVATASVGGRIAVWDVASRREVSQLKSDGGVLRIHFDPKGNVLAAGLGRGIARLWDAASGAELAVIKTSRTLPQVVFSRDGELALAATDDNAAHLLKPDGSELQVLLGHQSRISAADFSPDGQLVATASLDRTARIWSVKGGKTVGILKGHTDELTVVSFSPDGQSVLTASRDGTVRVWSVPDRIEQVVLRGHSGDVSSAQFNPSGHYVVTASRQDRTIRLWATKSGREIAILAKPEEGARPALTRAEFNSDGTRLAIVSSDSGVRLVRVFPSLQDLIAYAKGVVPRELTACERRRFFLPVDSEFGNCPS